MISSQVIYKEIETLTTQLIETGLSEEQNFPSCVRFPNNIYKIAYSGMQDISIALKNVEYAEIYNELNKNKNYNIKMIDGALIQFLYTYENSSLISHRLAFFPSPNLEAFQNESEMYEMDEIYADIIAKNILPVPIRLDYDPKNYQEIDHPKCHLTLGQFKNCRIPVSSPITPLTFMSLILRSFYNTAFKKFTDKFPSSQNLFSETITDAEKKLLHINIVI
ncbi:conserved hypothetical protein [Planktothrix serta PCC 8927]|uniref:DUF2290 domain-containing protein n=1 Tax=Planktothrix serta PCC 8927 TaxID=671068 RepID=A0A7Z9C1U4_9CYAN|nr:DUF2290 domain-containing protein [Planktothrix serta]VXD24041.1 conserved hypothetical protein [Planktothrix serta PCC 8927]